MSTPQRLALSRHETEIVASATIDSMKLMQDCIGERWRREYGRVFAMVTGIDVADTNGVWIADRDPQADDIWQAISAVRAEQAPWCVQVRPHLEPVVRDALSGLGLTRAGTIPLMAARQLTAADRHEELSVRRLAPAEAGVFCDTGALALGISRSEFAKAVSPRLLQRSEVRAYLGELDGTPVATALAILIDGTVGVYDVGTVEPYRRRGYGAAITRHAAGEALDGGARLAWLQSSDAGFRMYQSLGFQVLERWALWSEPS